MMKRSSLFVAAASLIGIVLSSQSAGAANVAEGTEPTAWDAHRLDMSLSATPFAVVSSMGGDGYMNDAKAGLVEVGPEATYSFRPFRYFELGAGAAYRIAFAAESGLYGHVLELPAHLGVVLPIARRVELDVAGYFGFSHFWLTDQPSSQIDSGSTLRTAGFHAGPRLSVSVQLTRSLDALAHAGVSWQFTEATNGRGYLDHVAVFGFAVPVGVGVRARL